MRNKNWMIIVAAVLAVLLAASAIRTAGQYRALQQAQAEADTLAAERQQTAQRIAEREQQLADQAQQEEESKPSYTVDLRGAIPEETGARRLSDEELEALSGLRVETAAAKIETLADAYAWLLQEGYSTTGISGLYESDNTLERRDLDWVSMSTALNVLLDGDYDEVGTLFCATQSDEDGWDFFYVTFNYVRVDGVYYVTDPQDHLPSTGLAHCHSHTIRAENLSVMKDALAEASGASTKILMVATYPLTYEGLWLDYAAETERVTILKPSNAKVLYPQG